MWLKVLIIIVLLAIAVSLFAALRTIVRNNEGDKKKTANLLTVRVSLSVALLILLALGMSMGWIEPHGVNPNAPATQQLQSQ